jgi:hypothetical protein
MCTRVSHTQGPVPGIVRTPRFLAHLPFLCSIYFRSVLISTCGTLGGLAFYALAQFVLQALHQKMGLEGAARHFVQGRVHCQDVGVGFREFREVRPYERARCSLVLGRGDPPSLVVS